MNTEKFTLTSIGQISLPVRNLQRAVSFYRDQLGMHFLFQVPGMAFFDCQGTRLMLAEPEQNSYHPSSSILYFHVNSIQQTSETLLASGVNFLQPAHRVAEMPDHDLWMAFFSDSEGNTLALMEERNKV